MGSIVRIGAVHCLEEDVQAEATEMRDTTCAKGLSAVTRPDQHEHCLNKQFELVSHFDHNIARKIRHKSTSSMILFNLLCVPTFLRPFDVGT